MTHSRLSGSRRILAALLILLLGLAACGINQDLLGSWQLTDAADTGMDPTTRFEFRGDRTLLVTPVTPGLVLTYTSSPGGDLSITSKREGSSLLTVKMKYKLTGDLLEITDEDGRTLIFTRLDSPAP